MGKEELDPQFVEQIDDMEQYMSDMQLNLQEIHHIAFEGLNNNDDLMKVILDIMDITRQYLI
jgi:hypothetical protein